MPDAVDTYAAKTQLSRLLARVEAGEEIVITRRGKPIARLVPAEARKPRIIGLLQGQFVAPADIHDGDEEIARAITTMEIEPGP